MLDTLTVPLDRFDLEGFLDAYRAFHRRWAGDDSEPPSSLFVLDGFFEPPIPMPEGVAPTEALLDQKKLVFVPIHEPPSGDTFLVIDGSEVATEELDIGVADAYGLLLEVHDEKLSVHPALLDGSSGPLPTLDLQSRLSVLDDRVAKFARKYVSTEGDSP